jgi:2',3'-cyclic-nucleotide 2'-phosphodiesterase/3'-nucleotidase
VPRSSGQAVLRLALLAALAVAPALARAEEATVILLHTTDLHGHVAPVEDYRERPAAHGLARLYTLIEEEREADSEALLFDAGDCIQGSPMQLVAHTRLAHLPDPTILVLNHAGYDALTVGNHEFDFGWERLEASRRSARFPWLSANAVRDGKPVFEPYGVFEVRGVRVGVLGLTTPAIPYWLDAEKYPGITFRDPVETAREWVPELRGRERCDAVVIVTHMGLERDPVTLEEHPAQMPSENLAYALARQIAGVDAIVMGHTHRAVDSVRVNGVLLTQAGRWADHLGRVQLRFERASEKEPWRLAASSATLRPVTLETEPSPEILALVEPYLAATQGYLDEVVAEATGEFSSPEGRLGESSLVDFIHAAQMRFAQAQVSLAANFNPSASFGPGPVRVRDLANAYVYENTLYAVEVTGRELREALEHSARYFEPYDFGRSDRPLVNPRVPGYQFDTAAGVEYRIDVSAPPGRRVRDLRYQGKPLEDAQRLRLAVNSYRRNGGGGYDMLKDAPVLWRSEEGMRELLIAFARAERSLEPRTDGNWGLDPPYLLHASRAACERLVQNAVWSAEQARAYVPEAALERGEFARWLETAYGRAGALASLAGAAPLPQERLDLWTALDWIAHAASGGARLEEEFKKKPEEAIAKRRAALLDAAPAVLQPSAAPPAYSRPALPDPVRLFVLENDLLAGWPAGANPTSLTLADGARLLDAALFPVVTLLETTDFHGAVEPREKERGTNRALGSTPVLGAYLARERAENPTGTILLDGGDLMQGTLISNLSFGRPVIEQMNRMGYDAAAVGNHEFDWTADTLQARIREARFAMLGANLYPKGGSAAVDWVESYRVFERRGVRVGVIGFCTVTTPRVTMPAYVTHLEFPDPAPIAQRWIDELRSQHGADVVVLVGHLPASQDTLWAPVRGELASLAAAVRGEDVALGGHSHNYVLGRDGETVLMIPGAHARAVGRVDLTLDRRSRRIVDRDAELIYTYADAVRPDSALAVFVDSLSRAVAPLAEQVLCEAAAPLTRDRTGESGIGNWVADAMRAATGAEVAIQNPGGLRADLDAGPVTVREVFEIMPFDNQIVVVSLTGAQLREALEQGISGRSCPQVSGVRLRFDRERPRGSRLISLELADGRPLEPDALYRVAVNDFMFQGGDNYDVLAKGRDAEMTSRLVRRAMEEDCLRRAGAGEKLEPLLDGRVESLEPEGMSSR